MGKIKDSGFYTKGKDIYGRYSQKRDTVLRKAARPKEKFPDEPEKKVFAKGCGFYKLFWVFVLGSFYGDIVETLWCRITAGEWMSRSSLVFGQFSIVWGLGCFLLTLFLHRLIGKDDRYIFLCGTLLGGAFEYLCSVFTEKVFGCIFWDYSHIPFNLNGRVNLLFCFFWGIMALVWLKIIYPWMSHGIEKIPIRFGKIMTFILIIFFAFDTAISAAALYRMKTRAEDIPPANWAERYVDEHFSDEWLMERYRNLKTVEHAESTFDINLGQPVTSRDDKIR